MMVKEAYRYREFNLQTRGCTSAWQLLGDLSTVLKLLLQLEVKK